MCCHASRRHLNKGDDGSFKSEVALVYEQPLGLILLAPQTRKATIYTTPMVTRQQNTFQQAITQLRHLLFTWRHKCTGWFTLYKGQRGPETAYLILLTSPPGGTFMSAKRGQWVASEQMGKVPLGVPKLWSPWWLRVVQRCIAKTTSISSEVYGQLKESCWSSIFWAIRSLNALNCNNKCCQAIFESNNVWI